MARDDEEVLHEVVRQVYNIETDDGLIRDAANPHCEIDRARNFDALRKNYRTRREFMNTTIFLENADPNLIRKFHALGFKTSQAD